MKLYIVQVDRNTVRLVRASNPPEGAIEMPREIDIDRERAKIIDGEVVISNIKKPKKPKQLSLKERIEVLEEKLK